MTRVVTMSLMLGFAPPVLAQSTTPLPAPADTTVASDSVTLDTSIGLGLVSTNAAPRVVAEPGRRDLRVAAHYPTAARETDAAILFQRRRAGLGQPMAMMIVGGAAVLLGAIIGDTPGTVIMIGGAVIGLIGLYEYLQ
jgi:hypothetical protein